MSALYERYRPWCLDQVCGQEEAVALLGRADLGGRAVLLAGGSGSGKTTLARIVARRLAEPWCVEELDAQDVTLEYVRTMERQFAYRGLGNREGRVWIINEVHGLRGAIVSRFLTLFESMPEWCTIVLTTTKRPGGSLFADCDDADPFFSRCLVVPMAYHGLAPHVPSALTRAFAERAREIAQREGLDGQPVEAYLQLALDCRHNLRQMLSRIEAGCMKGGA